MIVGGIINSKALDAICSSDPWQKNKKRKRPCGAAVLVSIHFRCPKRTILDVRASGGALNQDVLRTKINALREIEIPRNEKDKKMRRENKQRKIKSNPCYILETHWVSSSFFVCSSLILHFIYVNYKRVRSGLVMPKGRERERAIPWKKRLDNTCRLDKEEK